MADSRPWILALLILGCSQDEPRIVPPVAAVAQPPTRFADRALPATTLDAAPVGEQAAVVDAQLRVRPDRRFLIAVGDVYEMVSGAREEPEIAFNGGVWTVSVRGKNVGTLPERPIFADGVKLATDVARSLGAKREPSASKIDDSLLDAGALFRAAKTSEPADAARAAALINLQTIDKFGVADPVRARGLALLAIARAAGAHDTDEVAASLAESFGYEVEGRSPHWPAASAYLGARDGLGSASSAERARLMTTVPAHAIPLFVAGAQTEGVPTALSAANVVAFEVAHDLTYDRDTAAQAYAREVELEPAKILSMFERGIAAHARSLASRVFPEDVIRSWYEARFFSSLRGAYDTLHGYRGREMAGSFVTSLREPATPVGTQVRDWMRLEAAARYERGGGTTATQALARLPLLGGAARATILTRYASSVGGSDPDVRKSAYELFPQLDTRPAGLYEAGMLAHRVLTDPLRREIYLGAAIERAPSLARVGIRSWYYALTGDAAKLRALADSDEAPPADRAVALDELSKLPSVDQQYVAARFESLLGDSYAGVYPTFAGWANEHDQWAAKERAARRWLKRNQEIAESPIQVAYYASSLADALERQGRYAEAWAVVEPHVNVFSANIVSGAVSLLERLGRVDDAVGLGKRYMERYPGAESHADVARIYWRRGRYEEAAALFGASQSLDLSGLRTAVPVAFVETFEHAKPEEVTAAIEALNVKGIDSTLILDILVTARQAGQHANVLAAAEKLLTLPRWGVATVEGTAAAVEGWRAVKAIDGADAAAKWIHAKVPDRAALYVVSSAYQDGETDLVLAWATPRPDPAKSIEMLAFMAAAMTHARVPENDARRVALVETVRARGEHARTLLPVAQYLLGMMDEAAFLKWPYEPEGRAIAAYFVGLKAASAGDYDKALPWLIAASAGAPANPPRAWALETLSRWSNARMSWSEIRRAGIL